jgi:cobalamin synthase
MTGYPVSFDVEPQTADRNRLTTAFRLILAIPQVLIVGSPGSISFGANSGTGAFGAVVSVTSVLSWFAILFTGRYPRGLWDLAKMYMRWRANVVAYVALLRDEYPPFGTGAYAVTFDVEYPEQSNRWSVAFRLILAIPQLLALVVVLLAWVVTVIIAWFAILFTGRYPQGLYGFGVGVQRWTLRVQAYLFLMRDEYPPFSLE